MKTPIFCRKKLMDKSNGEWENNDMGKYKLHVYTV